MFASGALLLAGGRNDGEYELFLKSLPEDVVEPHAHHEARLSLCDGRHEEEFQSFIGG